LHCQSDHSGTWGILATGLFASTAINPNGPNGLLFGNPNQFLIQLLTIAVVVAFAFFGSYAVLKIINRVTPMRVTAEEEKRGLDESEFGEEAYYPRMGG
jgi:Amt family ammonium transporter